MSTRNYEIARHVGGSKIVLPENPPTANGDVLVADVPATVGGPVLANWQTLGAVLRLAGGTMEDGAGITFDTTTQAAAGDAANQVIIDGAGGTIENIVLDAGTY